MKYKALIFDLDGVISHTDQFHFQAWKTIADELGIPFDEKVNHQLRGISRMDSLEVILQSYPKELPREKTYYAEKKNHEYRRLLSTMTPEDLELEVKKTLEVLKQKGYMMAIGSSSKNARLILEKLGLEDYFDAVVDGNDIEHSKPHPEVFLKASEQLGIAPPQCLVIEDARAGIVAAIAANMDCVSFGETASHPKANYHIKRIAELLELLKEDEQ